MINGPALKIGPTAFLGIEQAAGRQSLLAVGAERHITCPSAYRAIGASVQKLWRAFGKLGVGSPALLFFSPRLPLVAASHTHLLPFLSVKPTACHSPPRGRVPPPPRGTRAKKDATKKDAKPGKEANEHGRQDLLHPRRALLSQ